jgi:hypothetical protein
MLFVVLSALLYGALAYGQALPGTIGANNSLISTIGINGEIKSWNFTNDFGLKWSIFNLSLIGPAQIFPYDTDIIGFNLGILSIKNNTIVGISLATIASYCANLYGVQSSLFYNEIGMDGGLIQVTIGANKVGNNYLGYEFGFMNNVNNNYLGLQMSLYDNHVGNDFFGVQLSLSLGDLIYLFSPSYYTTSLNEEEQGNTVGHDFFGIQMCPGFNVVDGDSYGFQFGYFGGNIDMGNLIGLQVGVMQNVVGKSSFGLQTSLWGNFFSRNLNKPITLDETHSTNEYLNGPLIVSLIHNVGDVTHSYYGLLASGFFNQGGSIYGIGISCCNILSDNIYGILIGGCNVCINLPSGIGIISSLVNIYIEKQDENTNNVFIGANTAFILNVGGNIAGIDVAPINVIRDMYGCQIGVVNIANHMNGLQIGFFNYAQSLHGIQLGGINISAKNGLPFMVGGNISL